MMSDDDLHYERKAMRYSRSRLWPMLLLALCTALGLHRPSAAFAAEPALSFSGCGGGMVNPVNADYEQQVVELVNARRAEHGLPPLKRVESLEYAARYHAADMALEDYFEHDSYDRHGDTLLKACDTWTRIASYYDGFANAENIGAGYATPADVMAGWMNSSGHRNNILNTSSREIGVGYYEGGNWGRYWVQNFGLRNNLYPLVINAEARWTESTAVTLYIYGQWAEMRLRNDDGPWGAWQPFQSTVAWTLRPEPGTRTVHVEMRTSGAGGQTASAHDTIWLAAAPSARAYMPLVIRRRP
jgi:uncharacterized protein YkwD